MHFFKSLVFLTAFLFSASVLAFDNIDKLDKIESCILWAGAGYPDLKEFEPDLIKDNPRRVAIGKGLEIFEEEAKEGSCAHQECLSCFYFIEKEYKKALYWANSSAKLGSSKGMAILAMAYWEGEGVVQDYDESFKWLFLASAAGDEVSIKRLERVKKIEGFESNEWVQTGKKKAQEWARDNPKAFFSPD